MKTIATALATALMFTASCSAAPAAPAKLETAVLAGGCYWGMDSVFDHVKGVRNVVSGWAGGNASMPHAEAVQIRFDPNQISYQQLLQIYFTVAHDPTQVNRQGNDRGRQYRSAVFFADAAQREVAEAYIKQLDEAKVFTAPIATEVVPLDAFYDAERYHQNYAAQHPEQSYIAYVAQPKVEKLKKDFGARLKDA